MGLPFHGNQHFKPLWKAAGYDEHMASAIVVRPPPSRYRRLYYLTTAEYAASAILLARLKVARINELNDPFEFLSVTNRKRTGAYEWSLKAKADAHEKFGILCFSEDWRSPALWSHYAAKHQGVCLGFDIKRTKVFQVEYKKRRTEEHLDESQAASEMPPEARLKTKSADWVYEKEWRMVLPLADQKLHGPLYFTPFGEDMKLSEVVLGARCTLPWEEMRAQTQQQYPTVAVTKARLARQHFSVVADEETIIHDLR